VFGTLTPTPVICVWSLLSGVFSKKLKVLCQFITKYKKIFNFFSNIEIYLTIKNKAANMVAFVLTFKSIGTFKIKIITVHPRFLRHGENKIFVILHLVHLNFIANFLTLSAPWAEWRR
jgi:hypothetical protein